MPMDHTAAIQQELRVLRGVVMSLATAAAETNFRTAREMRRAYRLDGAFDHAAYNLAAPALKALATIARCAGVQNEDTQDAQDEHEAR